MMRDSAHRSFFALAALALVPYMLFGLFGCGLLSVIAYRVTTDGIGGLNEGGQDLRLAAIFFGLAAVGTVVAAASIRRQLVATRRLAEAIRVASVPLSAGVTAAATRVGLGDRVDVVDDPRPFSFAYGLSPTRVAVSTGMVNAATPEELVAVFEHERYHIRSHDPFKVVVARAAAAAFFVFPAMRHLRDRYLATRELAADRRAVDAVGVRTLAGALNKVADSPAWVEAAGMAALGGTSHLDARVTQPELGHEPPSAPLPRSTVVLTIAALAAVTSIAVAAALSSGGAAADAASLPSTGPVGAAFKVAGALSCMCVWVVVGVLVRRRAMSHQRLTSRPTRTTTAT